MFHLLCRAKSRGSVHQITIFEEKGEPKRGVERDDDDDDDDDDVVLHNAVTPCYCSMLGVPGRVVSLEACCPQWALKLSVQTYH